MGALIDKRVLFFGGKGGVGKTTSASAMAVAASNSTFVLAYSNVGLSTDGGATWTLLSKSFGQGIDEFDFIDTARTMYIVTAQDNDNIRKLWWTGDSGATFTQIGDASTAWGTGNPSTTAFSTSINSHCSFHETFIIINEQT